MALTKVSAGVLNTDDLYGFRNRIINGAIEIDQRNSGASVTANNDVYPVDRFFFVAAQSSKMTAQQNQGSVTLPAGFRNYLGVTSSSAYTSGASEVFTVRHIIEGFNIADLDWGTANAKTVTLSFWVRSSLTGTFGGSLVNINGTRSRPFTYTIRSANTWEYETITIPGDTTGTWQTDNQRGIQIHWNLGTGSTSSGTADTWSSNTFYSVTGSTSVLATNGATWQITGVQFERGSVATPFERRPYGLELALCMRYFQISDRTSNNGFNGLPYVGGLTQSYGNATFRVPMRGSPGIVLFDGSSSGVVAHPGIAGGIAATASGISSTGFSLVNRSSGSFTSSYPVQAGYTADAELT